MPEYDNLSLKRSKHAWQSATEAQIRLRSDFGEYVTLVKNLPTYIANSGLGQTLVFLSSKGKKSSELLLKAISDWLLDEMNIYQVSNEKLIEKIQNGDIDQYRWATSETMELITWLKLHSGSIEKKDDSSSQNNQQPNDKVENQVTINSDDDIKTDNPEKKDLNSTNTEEVSEENPE